MNSNDRKNCLPVQRYSNEQQKTKNFLVNFKSYFLVSIVLTTQNYKLINTTYQQD